MSRCFICWIREELEFEFRGPTRFVDMEGGTSIFAEPNEIADRYHKALTISGRGRKIVLESASRLSPHSVSTTTMSRYCFSFWPVGPGDGGVR